MRNIDFDKFSEHRLVLRNYAKNFDTQLLEEIENIVKQNDFRHVKTPKGHQMSASMTNCGEYGWVSDKFGYRYEKTDPKTNQPWPKMPEIFRDLARSAADDSGYINFESDACLINRYRPKAAMALHQDKDEHDFTQPIVSISLGISVTFLFGGLTRTEKPVTKELHHGDIVVWGGPDRLRFHGVRPLKNNTHPLVGPFRFNLTLRKAN